jgi:hypothetical protein
MKLIVPKKREMIAAPYVLRSVGRHRTVDTSYTFRMGAGFAGDINRGHPASIEPCLIDPTNPVTAYGQPVLVVAASGGVRPLSVGDQTVTDIWGITARPYPIQQATTANQYGAVPYGSVAPPLAQPVDVMRGGYMMVPVVGSPVKGGTVYIWTAASGGGHTQGGFEAVNPAGSGCAMTNRWQWNSPPDATGIAEIIGSAY